MESGAYERNAELARTKTLLERALPPEYVKHISRFVGDMAIDGISKARQIFYMNHLKTIASTLEDKFLEPSIDDLKDMFVSFREERDYTAWTMTDYKHVTRRFYKWMSGKTDGGYPELVRWIRLGAPKSQNEKPKEIISKKELKLMVDACKNARDRAMISTLYDSCCMATPSGCIERQIILVDESG